ISASDREGAGDGYESVQRLPNPTCPRSRLRGYEMTAIFDIYLMEALLNGLLLGGVLALLALGLNLVFGVIDVVWICYAELVMFGMYAVFFLYTDHGMPLALAGPAAVVAVALMGMALHYLVIAPLLGTPPINQLL